MFSILQTKERNNVIKNTKIKLVLIETIDKKINVLYFRHSNMNDLINIGEKKAKKVKL